MAAAEREKHVANTPYPVFAYHLASIGRFARARHGAERALRDFGFDLGHAVACALEEGALERAAPRAPKAPPSRL